MRRDPDFFGDAELVLVYVARRLKDALRLEHVLSAGEVDYVVKPAQYSTGLLFRSQRVGAFFYVTSECESRTGALMLEHDYKPFVQS